MLNVHGVCTHKITWEGERRPRRTIRKHSRAEALEAQRVESARRKEPQTEMQNRKETTTCVSWRTIDRCTQIRRIYEIFVDDVVAGFCGEVRGSPAFSIRFTGQGCGRLMQRCVRANQSRNIRREKLVCVVRRFRHLPLLPSVFLSIYCIYAGSCLAPPPRSLPEQQINYINPCQALAFVQSKKTYLGFFSRHHLYYM